MRRSGRQQKGVAAIEFALVLIPLLLILFGITEFGRAIYQYNTLVKATRDAARHLTTVMPGEGHAEAVCLAVHGNKTCSGSVLAPGLTAAMVGIDESSEVIATGPINLVTVTINGYPFISAVPFVVPNITYGPVSTTMRTI